MFGLDFFDVLFGEGKFGMLFKEPFDKAAEHQCARYSDHPPDMPDSPKSESHTQDSNEHSNGRVFGKVDVFKRVFLLIKDMLLQNIIVWFMEI